LIALLGLTCIVLVSRRKAFRWGRLLVAAVVMTAGLSSYTDDIIRNSIDFSAAWWAFMLVIAITVMPYKPWQAFTFGMVVTAVFVLAPRAVVAVLNLEVIPTLGWQQTVFMIVLSLLCVGISTLIYTNRYYFFVKRKRIEYLERLTRRRFRTYVPQEVVSEIMKRPELVNLAGEKRCVTMVMSDLRGFSIVSESLPPERVVELLNIYLGRMADVISRYGGTIDEFIGDAIFVIFGAPTHYPDHALRAVACAIDMQRHMGEVNEELESRGMARIEMGVGVHTGEVIVGSIGSRTRAKYGAVGSHVNLTARIESYSVGGQVLATESTLLDAGNDVVIGRQMLLTTKGFSKPISIYEIEGVGEPYHLSLPVWDENLYDLSVPWHFDYSILDGKHLTGPTGKGTIDRLSTTGAVVRLSQPVEPLANLKMKLLGLSDESEPVGDLYCKVIDMMDERDVHVRFTAVPVDVADLVQQRCRPENAPSA
ncbi:MAG: adenylate/guanylate cyclase domain-containing protein, partial [Rhodothermales bacterium]|nr:adenylate/guanylate cyclase domain-containing protein [Rhodothermales bacterium]